MGPKVEDKKPFIIPKVEKVKNTALQKKENATLPGMVADSRKLSNSKTKLESKNKEKRNKDENRKDGPPSSRQRSPHRSRKRSRSRSTNRVDKPTEEGRRGRGGRGEDVSFSSRSGTRNCERVNEARYRKERDREKDESRERVGRSRCKGDKKGNDQERCRGVP